MATLTTYNRHRHRHLPPFMSYFIVSLGEPKIFYGLVSMKMPSRLPEMFVSSRSNKILHKTQCTPTNPNNNRLVKVHWALLLHESMIKKTNWVNPNGLVFNMILDRQNPIEYKTMTHEITRPNEPYTNTSIVGVCWGTLSLVQNLI